MRRKAALFLLVVIMFHSFVLVPKIYAGTVVDMAAARVVFRAVAPSVVAATPAGVGYWLAVAVSAGIIYMAVKSGAVTDLKNWLSTDGNPSHAGEDGFIGPQIQVGGQTRTYRIFWRPNDSKWCAELRGANGEYIAGGIYAYNTWLAAFQGVYGYAYTPPANPTVSTDYSTPLAAHMPTFTSNGVLYSPGGAAQLAASGGGGQIVKAEQKTDSELDTLAGALGMTAADPSTGAQPNPNANDNTITPGENQSLPLFQQMVNYLSNLLGIWADTGAIRTSADNLVAGQSAQTTAAQQSLGKMDNIATLTAQQKTSIDNVAAQTELMKTKIEHLDNAVSVAPTAGAVTSISNRLDGIYDTMMTKFPFSWFSVVPAPSGLQTGQSDDVLAHIGGVEIDYSPWKNTALNSILGTVKSMIGLFLWAVCAVGIYRRITLGES